MSRNAADASSSASGPPPGEHHTRTPHQRRSSHSPSGRTAPPDTQPAHRASPSSHAASQPPSSAALRVDTAAAASSSDPETGRRKRKQSERSSPSASSSQGDMADTEMEGGPSKPSTSEGGAPEGQPPKKKRTRTLTTPHQAAVLHALLAQSRFPTTQMREEVGRAIGLSARKVQIWFQNQRQKARRPRGQATTTTAPLTRPPQFGPFTNLPPGATSEVSPTTMAHLPASHLEGFLSRGHSAMGDMPYSARSAPSSAGSDRFTYGAHHDPYLAEEYARSGMPPTQLAGPGIPGSSRRLQFDDPAWPSRRSQAFLARPSTAPTDIPEPYRLAPRPGHPAGEQGPGLTLTLPPVLTAVARARAPGSSPISPLSAGASGGHPMLASISSLEASAAAHAQHQHQHQHQRPRSFEDARRPALPPPNVDFSHPRPVLNIPPPFTLQPQPQWDDPAFSPFTPRRSPPIPHGQGATAPSSATSSPTATRGGSGPFRAEPLPRLATVVPMTPSGPSPIRSPLSPVLRTRFDPVRSTTGRAPLEHPARPGPHDSADEQPSTSTRNR